MSKKTSTKKRTPGSLHPDCCAALVRYWTERRTRKLHNAVMASHKGDYATAMRETSEAEATLLCLQDLDEQVRHNSVLGDSSGKTKNANDVD